MAVEGACHGTVIHADQQSGGRGRGGREFLSPAGGLYFSLILRPRLDIHDLPLITLAAGVGLSNGIRQATGVRVQLKWPNDLYSNDRKLGGVLTESGPIKSGTVPEFLVIGVGVNVNTDLDKFPSSLRRKVISLYHHVACSPVDIDTLLKSFVSAMLDGVQRLAANREGLLADWRALDYLQGRMLEYAGHDGMVPATGVGLAGDGRYVICDHKGVEHSILAGDLNPIKLTS
jgi:BirA family biotin operon repressor/biotin-[acetyl-CoA-carboxylase] ligase